MQISFRGKFEDIYEVRTNLLKKHAIDRFFIESDGTYNYLTVDGKLADAIIKGIIDEN